MITKEMHDWAAVVLDSGFGHPQEVKNAMAIERLWCEQQRAMRLMQEEKQS